MKIGLSWKRRLEYLLLINYITFSTNIILIFIKKQVVHWSHYLPMPAISSHRCSVSTTEVHHRILTLWLYCTVFQSNHIRIWSVSIYVNRKIDGGTQSHFNISITQVTWQKWNLALSLHSHTNISLNGTLLSSV